MKKAILIILVVILVAAVVICNLPLNYNSVETRNLSYEKKIKLAVPEPSGLFFDDINNSLWTVSDEDSTIYQLSMDGIIVNSFKVDGWDLEGITQINDSVLVTILERDRGIVFVDQLGNELKRFKIDLTGKPNEGLEGIAFNPNKGSLFLLNEKNPGLLVEVDTSGKQLNKATLNFASDYSGLAYDTNKDELWIISDEGESIFKCKPDGSLIEQYKVDIEQIEGIAINFNESKIYIISDPLESLFIFNLP